MIIVYNGPCLHDPERNANCRILTEHFKQKYWQQLVEADSPKEVQTSSRSAKVRPKSTKKRSPNQSNRTLFYSEEPVQSRMTGQNTLLTVENHKISCSCISLKYYFCGLQEILVYHLHKISQTSCLHSSPANK